MFGWQQYALSDGSGLRKIDPQAAPMNNGDIFPLDVPLVGEYLMSAYMAPFMLPQGQPKDFFRPERFPDWEKRYHDQMRFPGFRKALLATIRHLSSTDPLAEYRALGKRGVPALLVRGVHDATVSAADMERVRQAIPGARFLAVEEAGHLSHYERPEIVNPALIGFLREMK